jgi:hypothetical protein
MTDALSAVNAMIEDMKKSINENVKAEVTKCVTEVGTFTVLVVNVLVECLKESGALKSDQYEDAIATLLDGSPAPQRELLRNFLLVLQGDVPELQ